MGTVSYLYTYKYTKLIIYLASLLPEKGKTSWFGCGSHIPGVLDAVPADQWCTCEPRVDVGGKKYPPKAAR